MGEVYRAQDSLLKREVALKVLTPEVAGDPERLARFQREAEVLASLNHPYIAQIYGVEESASDGLCLGPRGGRTGASDNRQSVNVPPSNGSYRVASVVR